MDNKKKHTYHYGYVITAACFGIQAIGIGTYVSYGVFFNSLASEFGWSRASISGASSLAFFLMGLFGIFAGRLNDKIGPRNVMSVTGFLFGLGHLFMSRVGTVWQLYLFYGIIIGIGLSSVDVIALSTTARWFVKKRGVMTGIVKIGTGAGQFIIPLIASILITSFGWRTSYFIIGTGVLLSLIAIAQLLRRDPSQILTLPNCDNDISVRQPARAGGEGLTLGEAAHTRQFWTICTVNLSIVFCFLTIMVHIVPHAQDIKISPTIAATVLSTIGGVSMAGRFITGIAIDRIGSKKAMILCFTLLMAGLLWLQIANELWMLYVFAIIYGIAHGGYFTTMSPIVAEFFGLNAHGVLFGIVAFSGTIGGAIGPILAGYIFDITAGYSLAFWLCTLMSASGLLLLLSLKQVDVMQQKNM
jgi:MFS family permease